MDKEHLKSVNRRIDFHLEVFFLSRRYYFLNFFFNGKKREWKKSLTCLSVKFKFLASSQRFCFDTYALKRNSFSNSSVWNLEYGLRFLRTVTWPVHSSAFDGVHDPTEPTVVDKPIQNEWIINHKWIRTQLNKSLLRDCDKTIFRMFNRQNIRLIWICVIHHDFRKSADFYGLANVRSFFSFIRSFIHSFTFSCLHYKNRRHLLHLYVSFCICVCVYV